MGIQLIIGFLDLFKGSLGKNSEVEASARAGMQNRKLEQEATPIVASL